MYYLHSGENYEDDESAAMEFRYKKARVPSKVSGNMRRDRSVNCIAKSCVMQFDGREEKASRWLLTNKRYLLL